ncbi:MAG: outer membrane beta-barrel protein [Paludibacteraceae bacterium]|nr:outer membrane beta-barrel protein [Paludibacteraceae bacterium]
MQRPEFYIGAHGGVSASIVYFNPSQPNMSPITKACVLGGNGGLVFRYAGHKYCAFQAELNYLHRGWATDGDDVERTERNLHYIEVPILMHLNVGSEKCRWFFNLGPQIGYCIIDESNSITKPFDWGLLAGTGVLFETRRAGIYHLEIRYDFSFGGVFGTSVTDAYKMANPMDLSLNLGWVMPIRKSKEESRKMKEESRKIKAEREKAQRQKELEQLYKIE